MFQKRKYQIVDIFYNSDYYSLKAEEFLQMKPEMLF